MDINFNQGARIVHQLSQLIVRGELSAGERLAEIPLSERFGVSRTPIRHALAVLEQEGLLVRDGSRSYVVRRFSLDEILSAIEVRAVLEGLAAGQVAERRLPWSLSRELDSILAEAEEIITAIESAGPTSELTTLYYNTNERFHEAIIAGASNRVIKTALEAASKVPFASVGSMARYTGSEEDPATGRERTRLLLLSHLQHQDIVEAMKAGQVQRAEALMREHAHLGIRNLHLREAQHSTAGSPGAATAGA